MSVKHINNYYKQICDQYNEMIENIKDLEKDVETGLVEPERIERLKEQVMPIKQNYERWTYMMFLLHQPNNKRKINKYKKQTAKFINNLSDSNSIGACLDENTECLKHIGE